MDFISSKSNVLLTDSVFAKNESGLLFHVKHNWWELGIDDTKIVSGNIQSGNLKIENTFVQFSDKRIAVLNKSLKIKETATSFQPLKLDYLIISNNTKMNIAEIEQLFDAKMIIFDSSNSEYNINKWKEDCSKSGQNYYSVIDNGAFELAM